MNDGPAVLPMGSTERLGLRGQLSISVTRSLGARSLGARSLSEWHHCRYLLSLTVTAYSAKASFQGELRSRNEALKFASEDERGIKTGQDESV